MRRSLISAAILFLPQIALAQLQPRGADPQYRVENFTSDNGLPQNTVSVIAQTSDGYLWIGTYDGLARFDGVRFTTFDKGNTPAIHGSQFLALLQDPHGTLWAGATQGGLLAYRNGRFISFPVNTQHNGYVGRLQMVTAGMIVFGGDSTTATLWKDDHGTPASNAVLSDITSPSGVRWIRADDHVTQYVGGKAVASYSLTITADEFARFHTHDNDSSLWLGTFRAGMYHLSHGVVRNYAVKEGLPVTERIKIAGRDPRGVLWAHSEHQLFRMEGEHFIPVDIGDPRNEVRGAMIDREGAVWAGKNTGGLVRVTPRFLTTYSVDQGLAGPVVYPVIDDAAGNVVVAAGARVSRLVNGRFTMIVDKAPQSLYRDTDGTILLGMNKGLLALRGGVLTDRSADVAYNAVRVMLRDRDSVLWEGGDGLFRIESGQPIKHYTTSDRLPSNMLTALLHARDGSIWAGTAEGLARLTNGRIDSVLMRGANIRSLYEDRTGALWIGTFEKGLARLTDGHFTIFTTNTGLLSNGAFAILEDRRGWLWMSSNRGISRVSRRELEEVANGRRTRVNAVPYGVVDGMRSSEANGGRQPSGLISRDGRLWFPTEDGVVAIDPTLAYNDAPPPIVSFENVAVDGKPRLGSAVRIQPREQDIEIAYTAPSFVKAERMQFRYRLSGINSEWVDAQNRRSVHYSHLAPGHYTFEVQAANSEGAWNGKSASIDLDVVPFFWQTGLFRLAMILAAIGIGIGVGGLRTRALKASEQRLTQVVEDRTKDLATANARLEHLSVSDPLTGIANRRRFDEFLDEEWRRASRARTPLALLMIDVDHFKAFNDQHGHQAGDNCLRVVASILAASVHRPSDLAARYGGEEFAVVLGGADAEIAMRIAQSIRMGVAARDIEAAPAASSHVSVSIGVAVITPTPDGDAGVTDLIAAADRALYAAKREGRNRVVMEGAATAV